MNTKLTLSIEKKVIEKAKKYAKDQKRSLSNIVEEYLKSISQINKDVNNNAWHPLVEELAGSVKATEGNSYEEIMAIKMIEKYSKR